jgi:hypothetical protein
VIGDVVQRKCNESGEIIGNAHVDPKQDTRIYRVRYPDGTMEELLYNSIIENLYSRCDTAGELHPVVKRIVGIVKPRRNPHILHKWILQIQWMDDTITEENVEVMRGSHLYEVAQYIHENGLANEPAFTRWVPQTLRQHARAIALVKRRSSHTPKIQYGIEIPRSIKHAYELDQLNGNTLWADAIALELKTLKDLNTFRCLPKGKRPSGSYQCIPIIWTFVVKMSGVHRARCCGGGHVTAPPTSNTYSGVVEKETVRISAWIEGANDMEMWMGDVTNAFPRAKCREQVYFIAGPEFGADEGSVVVIEMALYGLKTSGAAFHAYLADILRSLDYKMCKADPDAWFRLTTNPSGYKCYEYVVVYVDDILAISHDPQHVFDQLQAIFDMKNVGAPKTFLGANIGKCDEGDHEFRYMSSEQYLEEALTKIETKLGRPVTTKKIPTPTVGDFHPELDQSPLLSEKEHAFYQSLIGTLQWLVTLGRIDIHFATARLSNFSASPRENHLVQALRVFGYLRTNPKYKLVFDPYQRNWRKKKWIKADWKETYPEAKDQIPVDMPTPYGAAAQINFWCDAAFATDHVNRRSHFGIIIFIGNSPAIWKSGQIKSMETSAFSAEFSTLKLACELVVALMYKLRMLGIPIAGPANGFVDNQAVVLNSTNPSSTLKKRHNFIAYHYVRELIAANVIRLAHESGKDNIADILTKGANGTTHARLIQRILH